MSSRRPGQRCLLSLIGVLIALGFLGLQDHSVFGENDALSEKEMRSRRSKLRSAGGRYITRRKRFPSICPQCKGAGKNLYRRARGAEWRPCKQCNAFGTWVSRKDYKAIYYDMRSPAFRSMPGVEEALGSQYDLARRGQPWPLRIRRYRIHHWEMVGERHGIVWISLNGSGAPSATFWIYAEDERGRKSRWFIYSPKADGPWPGDGEDSTPVGGGEGGTTDGYAPVPTDLGARVRAALTQARITHRVTERMQSGTTLHLRLTPNGEASDLTPSIRVMIDAIKLLRALYALDVPWRRIETEWQFRFRDAHGREATRVRWVSALERSDHDGAAWATLSLHDQAKLANITEVEYTGWTPVGQAQPESKPATKKGPVIREDDGPVQEPSEPESPPTPEPGNEPSPEPHTPEPAAEPPATAPSTDALPELTDSARRKSQKGLERMKELMEAATKAFNDGVVAHKGGALDLWQEKLSEARAHLAEIEEAWLSDVVRFMPGEDEAVRDAVANEHFGEIWDDIYELKAMVRKMSRL